MKTWIWLAVVLGTGIAHADAILESDALVVTIDDAGRVAGLLDKANQVEYAAPGRCEGTASEETQNVGCGARHSQRPAQHHVLLRL
jgi:hypothetical protein